MGRGIILNESDTRIFIYYIQEYAIVPFDSGSGSYIVIKISRTIKKKQGHF